MLSSTLPPARRARLFTASRVVLFLLCVMYFLTYIDRVNVSTASLVFEKELGLSKIQLGFVLSAFAYPYLFLQVLGGYLSDRFGPRKVLTICSLIWAAATILTGVVYSFGAMLTVRFLLGLGEGATFPAATSVMAKWTKPADRGFVQGLTHACSRVGNSLAPPLVVLLMAWLGWRGSFMVMGVISIGWVAIWYWFFRDNPADHPSITPQELEGLPVAPPRPARRNPVPMKALIARMLPVTFVYFCYGWTLWLFLSWLPQYFSHQHHLNLKNSALFSMGVFLAGVLGDTLGGVISDYIYRRTGSLKMARRNLVAIFFICALLCMIPLFFTTNLNLLTISLSSAFFFAEMTIGPMWAIPMDIAPGYAGFASGIMNSGSALAAVLSPVVFGIIVEKTGNWSLPFLGSMGLFVLGAIGAFWMKPEEIFTAPQPSSGP